MLIPSLTLAECSWRKNRFAAFFTITTLSGLSCAFLSDCLTAKIFAVYAWNADAIC